MNTPRFLKSNNIAGFLIFSFGALYLASFCRYGINLWDEGDLYIGGMRYVAGQRVFRDFYGYQPAMYWIAEASFRIFGPQMMPVRYIFTAITGLFGLFAFQIGRRLMPPLFVAAAVLLVMSAPAVYYQRFYGLMFLMNAWAAIVCMEDRRRWPIVVIVAVLTYFSKAEVTLLAAPVYAWILLSRFNFKPVGFILLAVLFIAAFLLFQGDLMEFIFFKIRTERETWGNPFPIPWKGYQGESFGFFTFWENILFYLPFLASGTLFLLALKEKNEIIGSLSYFQGIALALVISRAGFDNLIRCLPLFFIVASYCAWRLVRSMPALNYRIAAAALFCILWVVYMAVFNFKNGFYTGSVGAVRSVNTEIQRGRAKGVVASREDATMIGQATDWIELATKKGDYIFAVPLNPIWYYLTDRMNPTPYDWVLPGTLWHPGEESRLVARLQETKPSLIVAVDIPIDNREERRLTGYAPKLVKMILSDYRYGGRVGYFQMWRRK